MSFFKGLQPQNNLIIFLFFMKHSYLLMAKITSDIHKSNFYMVWKSFCGLFSACLTQLLVSGYGLNLRSSNFSNTFWDIQDPPPYQISTLLHSVFIIRIFLWLLHCFCWYQQNLFKESYYQYWFYSKQHEQ